MLPFQLKKFSVRQFFLNEKQVDWLKSGLHFLFSKVEGKTYASFLVWVQNCVRCVNLSLLWNNCIDKPTFQVLCVLEIVTHQRQEYLCVGALLYKCVYKLILISFQMYTWLSKICG